jgi:CRP-like cAMP-binding protein
MRRAGLEQQSPSVLQAHHYAAEVTTGSVLYYSPLSLQNTLEQKGERLFKRKGEVLFRRGERACPMFVVLSGKVSLDFGVDSPLSRWYGAGASVGLPATLTRRSYRMNAAVIEDAEL